MTLRAIATETRFWKKVIKAAPDECWLWTDSLIRTGYGYLWANRRNVEAHRFSWEIHNGPIPAGLYVLHRCDVRHCVNPSHLFLGTKADNNADKCAKGRQARQLGQTNGAAKLNPLQVIGIPALYASGLTQDAIGHKL